MSRDERGGSLFTIAGFIGAVASLLGTLNQLGWLPATFTPSYLSSNTPVPTSSSPSASPSVADSPISDLSSSISSSPSNSPSTDSLPTASLETTSSSPISSLPPDVPTNSNASAPPPDTTQSISPPPQSTDPQAAGSHRIQFATDTTNTSISGELLPNQTQSYVLNCAEGQVLTIAIQTGDVSVSVVAPEGFPLQVANISSPQWQEKLLKNGDYTIAISSTTGSSYTVKLDVQ